MSRTLRFGSRTPVLHDRHVTRRRTNQSYDQLMAMDDAQRAIANEEARTFGKRPHAPPANTSFDEALKSRRFRFLDGE